MDLDAVFDRTGRVQRPRPGLVGRELWSLAAYRPAAPDPRELPRGGGRTVLVLPAFMMGDASTAPLRRFLARCGFRPSGWGLGLNWGPTPRLHEALRRQLRDLAAEAGRPVALAGVSLGGLLVRDLACELPALVSGIVTLASPFRLPTATRLEPLFRLLAPRYAAALDPRRLAGRLPVPATAIYTREDGLVASASCHGEDGTGIEVGGAHLTICRNPAALRAVVHALAALP